MTDTPVRRPADTVLRVLTPLRAAGAIGPAALAHAVHGLVLFVAIVGATFVADYPVWKMSVSAVAGVVLLYCAHVYSAVLAHQHAAEGSLQTGIATVWLEMRRTLPLLEACIVPTIPLLIAVTGALPAVVAYTTSLSISLLALAVVGFLALHNRRGSLRRSLLAGGHDGRFRRRHHRRRDVPALRPRSRDPRARDHQTVRRYGLLCPIG
ncbi:hypothetical protein ACTU3I_05160 [Microbacterium sp. RD1]|uniref:hypothetical protein n=1 Tax=Microbacterium sp. RD1 TaxID=3457313 RepID=UPI003FA5CF96